MSEVIDFNIDIASLTVRLVGQYKQTLDFCQDFLTDNENVDIMVRATAADVEREIARHPEGLSPEDAALCRAAVTAAVGGAVAYLTHKKKKEKDHN